MSIESSIYNRVIAASTEPYKSYPIVFLHGLMGFSANWGKIWPKFSNRDVLVIDQRGHGKSFKPASGNYGPENYAADLKELLVQLNWKKCHIVGHSMGGRVALKFATLYPEHTKTLTMEDSGVNSRPDRIDWIKNLLSKAPTPFSSRETAKQYFETAYSNDPMTGGFLNANLETKQDGKLDWRFFAPGMIETIEKGRATDATEEFTNLDVPTLIIRGEKSVEFTQAEAEKMAASAKKTKLEVIPDTGHFVHAEKPVEFSSILNLFISSHE